MLAEQARLQQASPRVRSTPVQQAPGERFLLTAGPTARAVPAASVAMVCLTRLPVGPERKVSPLVLAALAY